MTITVSQEAREAAERLFHAILGNMASYAEWGTPSYREAALREIEQSIRQSAERGEVVAWLYSRPNSTYPSLPGHTVVTTERWLNEDMHDGITGLKVWTETPLYTLSAPPEAV